MKRILICVLCSFSFLFAPKMVQISIPKSGTHLLLKGIRLLSGYSSYIGKSEYAYPLHMYFVSEKFFRRNLDLSGKKIWNTHHFLYDERLNNFFLENNVHIFFIYRDPRDQIISFAFYMKKCSGVWPKVKQKTIAEIIEDLIIANTLSDNNPPTKGIIELYESYLLWLENPNCLPIKFEDLIGPKGGGSLAAQTETLKKIAQHLEITKEKIDFVRENLFGGTSTVRQGQIGAWKQHFTQKHKEIFKKVGGDNLLIQLGYEKDENW